MNKNNDDIHLTQNQNQNSLHFIKRIWISPYAYAIKEYGQQHFLSPALSVEIGDHYYTLFCV